MSNISNFYIKPVIYTGSDALTQLSMYQGKRIGVVTDGFMAKSGTVDTILKNIPQAQVEVYSEVLPDPSVHIIRQGAAHLAALEPEVIVAIGGGSPMDAAKGIIAVLREMQPQQNIVLVAIPTTSGSGSEVTSYAIVSDPESNSKYPLVSPELTPDVTILDPRLVITAPKGITADTGMDVIAHALEAYASPKATDFSDALAEKALKLVHTYLPVAFQNGNDITAREKMHNAACIAGIAFNATGLGLIHGMAHAIGGVLHIPHGKINAMLMPIVIEYNAEITQTFSNKSCYTAKRYANCAKLLGLSAPSTRAGVKALTKEIRRINQNFGIPATLRELSSDLNLLAKNRDLIIKAALADGCTQTNPRTPSYEDVDKLITQIQG